MWKQELPFQRTESQMACRSVSSVSAQAAGAGVPQSHTAGRNPRFWGHRHTQLGRGQVAATVTFKPGKQLWSYNQSSQPLVFPVTSAMAECVEMSVCAWRCVCKVCAWSCVMEGCVCVWRGV